MFTDPPYTARVLSKRLAKYRFWDRRQLDASVACNAVQAAKVVAQQPLMTTVLPHLQNVIKTEDRTAILHKMYAHKPILLLINEIWRVLLLMPPRPPLVTTIQMLKKAGNAAPPNVFHAIVRTELGRGNYLECTDLLHLAPIAPLSQRLAVPGALSIMGVISSIVWSSSIPISLILASLWTGLAWICIIPPKYPRVQWRPNTTLYQKLCDNRRLLLANQIVTGFEELGSTNIANFHRTVDTKTYDISMELRLDELLAVHNIQRRQMKESDLYADYWSSNYKQWSQVEWHEPDQDPAEHPNQHK